MRSFLRSPAPILLLILAVPVLAIALSSAAGLKPPALAARFQIASIALLVIGLAIAFAGGQMGSVIRRMPLDERLVDIHLSIVLIGLTITVDGFALLWAIVSPAAGLFVCAAGAAWIIVGSTPRFRDVTISSSYVVGRSPETVFAFIADSRNLPRYQPDVELVEMLTSGRIGQGTRFRYRVRLGQQLAVGIEEILDYEPNHKLTTRVATGRRRNLAEVTFEPVEGGTRVTNRFSFERSIASALMGGYFRQPATTRKVLERRRAGESRIKQILESAPQ